MTKVFLRVAANLAKHLTPAQRAALADIKRKAHRAPSDRSKDD
jgi:hypothetical protein